MDDQTRTSIAEQLETSPQQTSKQKQASRWSRRTFLRGAALAGAGALALPKLSPVLAQQQSPTTTDQSTQDDTGAQPSESTAAATPPRFRTYPIPDSRTATPATEISFRGPQPSPVGQIKVVGEKTGNHSGVMTPHSDGYGASFIPDASFLPGEKVTVTTSLDIRNGTNGVFSFTVSQPVAPPASASTRNANDRTNRRAYHSRPDLAPPVMTVTKSGGQLARGYMVAAPKTVSAQNGNMLLDNNGEPVWFAPLNDPAESINDLRIQQYKGRPVLTYWRGISALGYGLGHYELVNQSYKTIATVRAANGYRGGDLHEFIITPQNTALFTVYSQIQWDLSSAGGPADGVAVDGIAQEVDIETGRVLFEWHSLDHVPLTESYLAYNNEKPAPYDYFHINSLDIDQDQNFVISSRHTSTVYKVDRRGGEIIWRLNGKGSNFQMGQGTAFAFQHDARPLANGNLSIFDNASDGNNTPAPGVAKQSRGMVLALDLNAMTATLAAQYQHPDGVLATSQGNLQLLPNGNAFVGWGAAPHASEFSSDGTLLFDVQFPDKEYSYRSYRSPWTGYPKDTPAVAATTDASSGKTTVYASWNGATEVATWEVLTGAATDQLKVAGSMPSSGFETTLTVDGPAAYVAVQAKNQDGDIIGTSQAVQPGK